MLLEECFGVGRKEGAIPGDAPPFSYDGVNPVPRKTFPTILDKALGMAAEDPQQFSGSMFRRGGAQALNFAGFSDTTIKKLGRWKTDHYRRYFKMNAVEYAEAMRALSRAKDTRVVDR